MDILKNFYLTPYDTEQEFYPQFEERRELAGLFQTSDFSDHTIEDNLLLRETFCEPAANNITHFPHTNFITNDLKLSSRNHLEDNGGKYDMKATGAQVILMLGQKKASI